MNFLEDFSLKEGFEWTDRAAGKVGGDLQTQGNDTWGWAGNVSRRTQMKKDLEIKSGTKISLGTDSRTWQTSSSSVGLSPSLIRDWHNIPKFPAAWPGERGGLKYWHQCLQKWLLSQNKPFSMNLGYKAHSLKKIQTKSTPNIYVQVGYYFH